MNYKLAKQLKDAGFPQNTVSHFVLQSGFRRKGISGLEDEPFWDWGIKHGGIFNSEKDVASPTLSELIEACLPFGRDFSLTWRENGYGSPKGEKWNAVIQWKAGINSPVRESSGYSNEEIGWGETPEEAVANLWLRLQEKK